MATHSSILAWRIPWTEKPGALSPWGHKESDMTERLTQNTAGRKTQQIAPLLSLALFGQSVEI